MVISKMHTNIIQTFHHVEYNFQVTHCMGTYMLGTNINIQHLHEETKSAVYLVSRVVLPSWFLRPDVPLASCPRTAPSPRTQIDLSKASEPPVDSTRVHGQTPTICTSIKCTANGCTCNSFTPGKRHLRYCDKCQHGWVFHGKHSSLDFE